MANIELLLNPTISPVYITATNMIVPISTITLKSFTETTYKLYSTSLRVLEIIFHTSSFIIHQAFNEIETYLLKHPLDIEKTMYTILLCSIFMAILLFNSIRQSYEQSERIGSLERKIHILEKETLLRNNMDEVWSEDIKIFHNEINIKYSILDKKIKKIERELKQFE